MALQEGAGGVGAVDLEALVLGAVALDEPDVVEHGADVEQLGVVVQPELLALQRTPRNTRREWSNSSCVGHVPHELGRLASERAVGIGIPAMAGLRITLMRFRLARTSDGVRIPLGHVLRIGARDHRWGARSEPSFRS